MEAGSLFAFQAAKLQHFDEQGESGHIRDAGDGEENLEPPSEWRVLEDELFDGGVDLLDFEADLGDAPFVLLFEQRNRDRLGAVFGGGSVFHERRAGQMQLLQVGNGPADARTGRKFKNLAHAREHGGVGAIGFNKLASGLGETARLAWIDLGDR